jgi:transposase-like protein
MNLIDVTRDFATEDACLEYLEQMRWPGGLACLACGSMKVKRLEIRKGRRGKTRRVYQCLERPCLHQFTATTGTIFHDTHLPLRKWFIAIALITDAKKGMSANQMKRHLKVQYRTAWHLCHRIRKAMEEGELPQFTGTVEADETYLGGKYDKRRKRGPWENPGVMGIIERGGKVTARAFSTPSKQVLVGIIRDQVSPEARMIVTDQLRAYSSLHKEYNHAVINHIREYVRGKIHTNTIENFWSLLKRGVMGSFHKVSIKHLPRYLAEFTYRFNRRDIPDLFSETLSRLVFAESLPYEKLVAK